MARASASGSSGFPGRRADRSSSSWQPSTAISTRVGFQALVPACEVRLPAALTRVARRSSAGEIAWVAGRSVVL